MTTSKQNGANLGFEHKLWEMADKLRGHMDASEYKHVVLGLIFLKYISDAFQAKQEELKEKQETEYTDPEDRDEYLAANIFWVPPEARWETIQAHAPQPTIGRVIDEAMASIERENPSLKGVLSKDYSRPTLDKTRLGELVKLVGDIDLRARTSGVKDKLGRVYEYFIGRFAAAEGKSGGEFYTPQYVVQLLVQMIEPYKGRVYDPCCGSGGMFVQSEKFVEERGGKLGDIAIYGQESNPTTWRLAKMNLAIRRIDADLGPHHADSFHSDLHKDLKADYILANPPFNMSDWGGERLREDPRWKYGVPPANNANYAWIQHFIYHLAPNGIAGFVMANGSLSTSTNAELAIRKELIEDDLVDCIVALPGQLFYTTQIPVSLWFVTRNKKEDPRRGFRHRNGETLFIDARRIGHLVDRVHRELTPEEIEQIASVYHTWKTGKDYEDKAGWWESVSTDKIRQRGYVLTPGRHVGVEEQKDDLPAPRPGVFFVYAIKCEGGSYYIGHTDNIPRRWQEHISGNGADWTKKHKPIYIAHYEEFTSREEAIEREKELKTTNGRRWLKKAIAEGRARQAGGVPFEEKMAELTAKLYEQFDEAHKLEAAIKKNLEVLGYGE